MRRIVIIGGGIVGCHIALRCAKDGHETYLLEKNSQLGQETSSRNSCVLHAGIYYKPGSLKARLCVEGNARSREFFEAFGVGYRATGKYIISRTPDEDDEIERLHENARANGVPGMERAGAAEVPRRCPISRAAEGSCRKAPRSSTSAITWR
jgi:L-2-hydroxyglutarate oxidase LhgO